MCVVNEEAVPPSEESIGVEGNGVVNHSAGNITMPVLETAELKDKIGVNQVELRELAGSLFELRCENDQLRMDVAFLKKEREEMKEHIQAAQKQLRLEEERRNHLEQWGRQWNLRIWGIGGDKRNESAKECISRVIHFLQSHLNIHDVTMDAIEIAHRLGKHKEGNDRVVIVRFIRRTVRNYVLGQRRRLKGTRCSINEDLTQVNQELLRTAREKVGVKHAWSWEGKIFVSLPYGRIEQIHRHTPLRDLIDSETFPSLYNHQANNPSTSQEKPQQPPKQRRQQQKLQHQRQEKPQQQRPQQQRQQKPQGQEMPQQQRQLPPETQKSQQLRVQQRDSNVQEQWQTKHTSGGTASTSGQELSSTARPVITYQTSSKDLRNSEVSHSVQFGSVSYPVTVLTPVEQDMPQRSDSPDDTGTSRRDIGTVVEELEGTLSSHTPGSDMQQ